MSLVVCVCVSVCVYTSLYKFFNQMLHFVFVLEIIVTKIVRGYINYISFLKMTHNHPKSAIVGCSTQCKTVFTTSLYSVDRRVRVGVSRNLEA